MASNMKENVEKLKQELRDYKTGSKLGTQAFQDAEPGEMENMKVRMSIFGMTGSGKSTLVNTVMKVLLGKEERGTAIEQSSGGEGTISMEEFLPQFDFTLIDTRGFFEFDALQETELFRILYGTVRDGEVIDRGPMGELKRRSAGAAGHKLNKPPIAQQAHVVLWVIKANDVRLTKDKYKDKFKFVTQMLAKECITIVTVVTCDDEIRTHQREEVIRKAREATLSIKPNTFLIANWLSNQDEYDITYENEVVNMLHTALKCGERSIKMRQSKREISRPGRSAGPDENEDDSLNLL